MIPTFIYSLLLLVALYIDSYYYYSAFVFIKQQLLFWFAYVEF